MSDEARLKPELDDQDGRVAIGGDSWTRWGDAREHALLACDLINSRDRARKAGEDAAIRKDADERARVGTSSPAPSRARRAAERMKEALRINALDGTFFVEPLHAERIICEEYADVERENDRLHKCLIELRHIANQRETMDLSVSLVLVRMLQRMLKEGY